MSLQEYKSQPKLERLNIFMNSLSKTNRTPEYYVNWIKVEKNTREFELELNTMNYLLGKSNIEEEATRLFTNQPNLLTAIPSLIASRDKKLEVLILDEDDLDFIDLDFTSPDVNKLDDYMEFLNDSGLLAFMKQNISRNLVDYVYGVEAGLDSNARKNRSGTTMESIINRYVTELVDGSNYYTQSQASAAFILQEWGVEIPVDKANRRFDEAIFDKRNNHVYLLETNYYGGGGSKLKAVAGEFSNLNNSLKNKPNVTFIWVTDGQGWKTARLPLEEAFSNIENIFNLDMLSKGYLKDLILRN